MKIELYHSELATLLKALSPFTNPQEWESEEFENINNILKEKIADPFIRSCASGHAKIFYPGEWNISTIIDTVREREYFNILIVGDEYKYNEIYNICNSVDNPHIKIANKTRNFIDFYSGPMCHFLNCKDENIENKIRGTRYDCMFL